MIVRLRRLVALVICCVLLPIGEVRAVSATASPVATQAEAPLGATEQIPFPSPTPIPSPTATPEPALWSNLTVSELALETLKDGSTGDPVFMMQNRLKSLGFYSYKATGQFGRVTTNAVKAFQAAHKLKVDGVAGIETLTLMYSNLAERGSVNRTAATPTPSPKPRKKPEPGIYIEWAKAKSLLKPGSTATLIDFATGYDWKIRRLGGDNHMDVEPYTAKDTALFKQAVGRWSWSRRPALLRVGSKNYACSINTMPHAPQRVANNNYDGHHCIHFLDSRTHGTNSKDPDHQRCVKIAAGKK